MLSIAVMGDRREGFAPQDTLEDALAHAAAKSGLSIDMVWLGTAAIGRDPARVLQGFDGLIAAPGDVDDLEGALAGLTFARRTGCPLLGTCGGFQHAVLEFARNVAGLPEAQHEYYAPDASTLVLTAFSCSIFGQAMEVELVAGTLARRLFAADRSVEAYYCGHGIDAKYEARLVSAGLIVSGRDREAAPRVVELAAHPFYLATLFVPQTRSTADAPHPVFLGFLEAAARQRDERAGCGSSPEASIRL